MTSEKMHAAVRPAESVKSMRDADGAVLLDTQQGTCYGTNKVGSRIWQLLEERWPVEQIVLEGVVANGQNRDHAERTAGTLASRLRNGLKCLINSRRSKRT